jgi:hypothetical protein
MNRHLLMHALEPTILSTSPSYKQRPGTITQSSLAGFIFGDILSIFPSIFPSISVLKTHLAAQRMLQMS